MNTGFETMKEGLRKIVSRARSRFVRRGSQEGQRNMMPPRSTASANASITPFTAAREAGLSDVAIATPGTPSVGTTNAPTKTHSSWWNKTNQRLPAPVTDIQESQPKDLHAEVFEVGITGVDWNLPLYDGLSKSAADHLIDLDSDSMERCADVRVYFWTIGDRVQRQQQWRLEEPTIERPIDPELLPAYDEGLVKRGRQYLKESMIRKEGYYLSRERDGLDDYLAQIHPDHPWYRLSTLGLVKQLEPEVTKDMEEENDLEPEDSFFDADHDKLNLLDVVKTNIRVPMIWLETLKEGIVPGNAGWDTSIITRYYRSIHPVFTHLTDGCTDSRLISIVLVSSNCAPPNRNPCDIDLARQVIVRDFSHFSREDDQKDKMDPQMKAKLRAKLMKSMTSCDEIIYGKPGYRRKSFLGISW